MELLAYRRPGLLSSKSVQQKEVVPFFQKVLSQEPSVRESYSFHFPLPVTTSVMKNLTSYCDGPFAVLGSQSDGLQEVKSTTPVRVETLDDKQ